MQDYHADCFHGGAELPADGGYGRHTGGIQQGKDQKADGGPGREHPGDGRTAQQDLQGADDRFLGDKARNEGGGAAPIGYKSYPPRH